MHIPHVDPDLNGKASAHADAFASERARLRRELADARSALDQVRAERDALRASRSWRITAPLRALMAWWQRPAVPQDGAKRLVSREGYAVALPRDTRRQLFVDVTELVVEDLRGGVQRVVKAVLAELLAQPPTGWHVVPVRLAREGDYVEANDAVAQRVGVAATRADRRIAPRSGDVFLGLDLVRDHAESFDTALCMMRAHGVATWVVVYDTLPLDLPACFPAGIPQAFEAWFKVAARRADGLACISRTVAKRATHHLPAGAMPHIVDFPLGADAVENVPARSSKGRSQVLMVGTIEPRKRYDDALDALARLHADSAHADVVLTIVGRPGWADPAFLHHLRTHPELGRRLHWFADADDGVLARAYAQADALLSCSIGEGYGLPLVEAARHGLKLVLRDLPEFREVAGPSALYFGPGTAYPDAAAALRAWRAGEGVAVEGALHVLSSWQASARALGDAIGIGR